MTSLFSFFYSFLYMLFFWIHFLFLFYLLFFLFFFFSLFLFLSTLTILFHSPFSDFELCLLFLFCPFFFLFFFLASYSFSFTFSYYCNFLKSILRFRILLDIILDPMDPSWPKITTNTYFNSTKANKLITILVRLFTQTWPTKTGQLPPLYTIKLPSKFMKNTFILTFTLKNKASF